MVYHWTCGCGQDFESTDEKEATDAIRGHVEHALGWKQPGCFTGHHKWTEAVQRDGSRVRTDETFATKLVPYAMIACGGSVEYFAVMSQADLNAVDVYWLFIAGKGHRSAEAEEIEGQVGPTASEVLIPRLIEMGVITDPSDIEAGNDDTQTGTEAGDNTETGTETGDNTQTGTETGDDTQTGTETGDDTQTGTETGDDTQTGTETGDDTQTGTETGDSNTEADDGTQTDTQTGTETGDGTGTVWQRKSLRQKSPHLKSRRRNL